MSDSSSDGTSSRSFGVRKMKKATRSTLGSCLSCPRRKRSSHDGRPVTCRTRILSRMTLSKNERALFSAIASPSSTGVEISYRYLPTRSGVNWNATL